MSWSVTLTVQTGAKIDLDAELLADRVAPLDGPAVAESRDQIAAAVAAAELVLSTGALGPIGTTVALTLNGHANAEHAPTNGYVGDMVSMSIVQVGYPPAGATPENTGPGSVTPSVPLRAAGAVPEAPPVTPVAPLHESGVAADEHAAATIADAELAAELASSPAAEAAAAPDLSGAGWDAQRQALAPEGVTPDVVAAGVEALANEAEPKVGEVDAFRTAIENAPREVLDDVRRLLGLGSSEPITPDHLAVAAEVAKQEAAPPGGEGS